MGAAISRRLFATTGLVGLAGLAGCALDPRPPSTPRAPIAPSVPPTPAPAPQPEAAPPPPPEPFPRCASANDAPPLFRAYPGLRHRIPHIALGAFPTAVARAPALGERIGVSSLWIKHDDTSGHAYGGGKVRKLEHLLGEAVKRGARTVVTFGGVGSNHAVATSIYAERLGLRTVLLLLPEPADDRVRQNLLACARAGAEMHLATRTQGANPEALARRFADTDGTPAYVIPAGGTSALGNVGFVNAAFELAEQVNTRVMPPPDVIYAAMGTAGSVAGLAVGLRAAGLSARVTAVRASSPGTSSEARLLAAAAETVALLRAHDPSFPAVEIRRGDVTIEPRQLGAGYGRPTRKGLAAIELAREHAKLELDPVYTGKALAALIDDAATPMLAGRVALFWNSHNGHALDLTGVGEEALPPALRGYFVSTKSKRS